METVVIGVLFLVIFFCLVIVLVMRLYRKIRTKIDPNYVPPKGIDLSPKEIVEIRCLGEGEPQPKRLGAKGAIYGATHVGWLGALLMPFEPDGTKNTVRYWIKYNDGTTEVKDVVYWSREYHKLMERIK